MASSGKSKQSKLPGLETAVGAALEPLLFPRARLVLGLSGGLDSIVLLDALHRLARPLGFKLACVHVNHGISPNARRWADFCARKCKRLGIALDVQLVDVAPYRAEGLEAAARRARYAVYARQEADFIVLAQHLDDQAETLLLQLLRGAGVKGGAAMPLLRSQGRGGMAVRAPAILRPMLALSRQQIEAYARVRKLTWVEDESNADTRYDRNFLRHEVLPAIARGFPAYRATLARSARHLAEASLVLDELAAADAISSAAGNKLPLAELKRIGAVRTKNLVRWLLQQQGAGAPETDRLEEGLRQVFQARDDAAVHVVLGAFELRRYDGCAYLLRALPEAPADLSRVWDAKRTWALPELGGTLRFARVTGAGLDCASVRAAGLSARLRQGGEKLRLQTAGSTRSLKNLLQEARMPPWERERLPLLYCCDVLVAVPGLGVASGWQAAAGMPGWTINWQRLDWRDPGAASTDT
ncbi:MAG: tRNA lysidine(34) synthetase TilS [Proteobacteria bacterium]|nr:tRNA lysidine(34) synthetase TilS [Pseudomonadota bacterium]